MLAVSIQETVATPDADKSNDDADLEQDHLHDLLQGLALRRAFPNDRNMGSEISGKFVSAANP